MTLAELNLSAASVEIFIFIFACAALIADLFVPRHLRARLHWAVIAGLLVAAHAAFAGINAPATLALGGFYDSSPQTAALKGVCLLAVAGCLAFSRHTLRAQKMLHGDFWGLALLAALGMLVIVSAAHLLILYLGLELMSLCLYALIGMRRDNAAASEAAIKYFVLGALSSGLFLYGVSLVYGATGELAIAQVASAAAAATDGEGERLVLVFGLVFMLAGMAFKLGVAPFHMWLPDVYQGAPAPVTLFLSAAPKVAALAMLTRVLAEALPAFEADWRQMLMFLAVASLAVGNIAAIAQTNIKRMLAYSAIAHSGFLLLGVLAGGAGVAAASFYVCAYALMTVGGFGLLALLTIGGRERAELQDMRGLAARNMPLALVFAALMLSMAGVPPFVGFVAKLTVLQAVVSAGLWQLAVAAVALSLVGAFYYLRIIRLMFFDKAQDANAAPLRLRPQAQALALFAGGLTLWFGVFPSQLLALFAVAP